jgi:hypothetical protein
MVGKHEALKSNYSTKKEREKYVYTHTCIHMHHLAT